MAGASNLRLKGNLYHFRRKIPPGLRERIGKAEWVRSLGTGSARVAAARARELWLATEEILRQVKDDPTITRADLDRLVKEALEDFAWADEVRLAAHGRHFDVTGPAPADFDQIALESWADHYRASLARNDLTPVRDMIGKYAQRLELDVAAGSVDERLVGRALLQALARSCDDAAERFRREVRPYLPGLEGAVEMEAAPSAPQNGAPPSVRVVPHVEASPQTPAAAPTVVAAPSPATPLFSEVWERFRLDCLSVTKATEGELAHDRSSVTLWLEICGDKPLGDYVKADAAEFRRTVARLPNNYHRSKRWRGKSVAQTVEAADAADKRAEDRSKLIARLSTKTVNRHLSVLRSIWKWAPSQGLLPQDYADIFAGLHVTQKKSKKAVRDERNMWMPDMVRKLFKTPVWTGCKSRGRRGLPGPHIFRDWKFWIPLLCAHSGMRREEICALKVKDVRQVGGVWHIDLFNVDFKLKTEGSERWVPIHQDLLDIGFVEDLIAGRRGQEYLFPELKPSTIHEKHGDPFTKWFTPYRRNFELYEEKIAFHSFRHTVSTLLVNAKVPKVWVTEITGHEFEGRSELDRYNKGVFLRNLKEAIDLLDYGLDLSHLKAKVPPRER